MPAIPALVSALRELGDRPAVIADGRAVSGIGLLLGVTPQGGLPEVLAERITSLAMLPAAESAPVEGRLRHWASILGPPPIRHTVLYPATELGVELGLATLLGGGTVICADPEQPDELPAHLERSGTTHLTLPSELLWKLSRSPALHRSDLTALRQVLHVGPEPSQEDVYTAMDALGAVVAHIRRPRSDAEAADLALREVLGAAADTAWKQAIGVTAEQAALFVDRLDDAVLSSMLLTLQRGGVLTAPAREHSLAEILDAVDVAAEHRPLVGRWLRVLSQRGSISSRAGRFHGGPPVDPAHTDAAWESAAETWTGRLGAATVIDYLRHSADKLPELLSGEQSGRSMLFPAGSTRIMDALTRRTASARYLGSALGTAARHIAAAHRGPRPLRVLELGAGTSAATTAISDALATACGATLTVDYVCTERSRLLLDTVPSRLRRHAWLRFEHLDPQDRPGVLAPDAFDLVVSTGVLGEARDAAAAARRLVRLLAPGGWLLAVEQIRDHPELLISRAFVDPESLRRDGEPPSRQQWLDALSAAGVGTVVTLPGQDHPVTLLGHQLFAARLP
ncbi:methyltransferase [Kitasatospora herbaricolor]|uniref:methyltransferase n=1 Tax=Kitasatospora herbaricolor TaxID=68217 RepID=UPI0036DA99F3